VHAGIIGDIVAIVLQRRGVEGQEPDSGDPEILQIIQLLRQPCEVSHPIAVAVIEGAGMEFVDDGVFVPQGIVR
jgi:hypothetical protein